MARRTTTENETRDRAATRYKKGTTKRKEAKMTSEAQLDASALEWKKGYAVFLKAADFSYMYISDVIRVQRTIVKRWFEDPEMQKRVEEVREDVTENAIEFLKRAQIELVQLLLEVARTETDGRVRLQAITEGLDRVGLAKVNKSESKVLKTEKSEHEFSSGFFERLEGLPLETQKKLAEMADEMDTLIQSAKGSE